MTSRMATYLPPRPAALAVMPRESARQGALTAVDWSLMALAIAAWMDAAAAQVLAHVVRVANRAVVTGTLLHAPSLSYAPKRVFTRAFQFKLSEGDKVYSAS